VKKGSKDLLGEFAALVSEQFKESKPTEKAITEKIDVESNTTDTVQKYAEMFSRKAHVNEQQDPLVPLNQDFLTRKDLEDHYKLFISRIQTQLASIGGGGEVNLRGLDDVLTSSTGTNKFLTYNPSTRKFYFDYISAGAGFSLTDGVLGLNAGPMFELDESDVFQLKAGTADRIGGIKAGDGVAIDPDGTLFIDSEGLPFTFGDFTGLVGTYSSNTAYALLGSVNEDEDIVIASNGDGGVKVVGEFRVYAPNGTVTAALEDSDPFFQVKGDGQVQILVPLADTTEGGVEIIGSELGTSLQPGIAGTMLHMTGNAELPTRVYHDTLDNYSSYVFRRYNGSAETPTQVLADEAVARINFTPATDAGMGNVAFAQIRVQALEDQTTTAMGSEIQFFVTPEGSPATSRISALDIRAAGVTSDVGFIGDLTGSVTFPTRQAGSFGAGQTITIDFATDRFVHCTITGEVVTVAYTNITPGKEVSVYFTLAAIGDKEVNFGIPATNTSNAKSSENIKAGGTSQITVTSFGTTVNDCYMHFKK
jgi:hypothetical protein